MIYNCHLESLDLQALIDIKGDRLDVLPRLQRLALADPPVLRWASAGALRVLRPSPQHWLLRAPLPSEDRLLLELMDPAPVSDTLIVPVSDAYGWFKLGGSQAREVMAIACPLDLDPKAFGADSATFTEVFGLKTLLWVSADDFELAVDRSHAPLMADWFARVQGGR